MSQPYRLLVPKAAAGRPSRKLLDRTNWSIVVVSPKRLSEYRSPR